MIHRRERIQIRIPGGACLSTFIRDIEMINRGRDRGSVAFSLPRGITRRTFLMVASYRWSGTGMNH